MALAQLSFFLVIQGFLDSNILSRQASEPDIGHTLIILHAPFLCSPIFLTRCSTVAQMEYEWKQNPLSTFCEVRLRHYAPNWKRLT
jgi:hypothetical protein